MASCALALVLALTLSNPDPSARTGRVVDPEGRPVRAAEVLIDGPLGTRVVRTDDNGEFSLPADLSSGTYRLLVGVSGFIADPLTVHVPSQESPLTITLRIAPVSDAIVVSAAQVPRPLSEAPATTSVISREEVASRQLESVADAIRTVPGFSVGRNGGRGALTSVFPRGGDSDYTLVLVDGMRVNAFGGGFDFSLLPFGDVDQVEVVRGPQSALYGSDAIGGIVQVTTRHGGSPTGSASFDGGSEKFAHGRAGGAGSIDQWSFGGGVERTTTRGFTGIAPASGEDVSNDNWGSTNAAGSIGWSKNATAIRGDARWIDAERGSPGPYGSNPIGVFAGVDRVARGFDTDKQFSLQARTPWGRLLDGRVQQRVQVTYADLDNRYHSSLGDSFFNTRRFTARAQTDLAATTTTGLSFGVEGLAERARGTYFVGEASQEVPIERRTIGVFGEVRQQFGPRATVTAGVRVESIRRDALEGDPNPFGPRPTFSVDSVTSTNPRASVSIVVWQDSKGAARTTLRGSAGTGIRPPDAYEIAFTDNPSLQPERSKSADVGVSQVLGSRLVGDATFFYNRYDDLIVAVGSAFNGLSRYRTDNISNARARGLEIGLSWSGPAGLLARGAYTLLDSEILAVDGSAIAPSPFTVGDRLLRRPKHQGSLDLIWTHGPVSAFVEGRARGRVLDVEPNYGTFGGLFDAAGYAVADAGATWRLTRSVDVFARVLNAFDRPYEEFLGYPAPGRLGVAGVRVAVRP
jgi:outer membrane cobalamin receptor